ncbi:MAG TPA: pyridoxamine 5'-phosphate oxidase family protein [Solirubrobacterales bacterium]|nr:pyridoxamine 5'-phosphate oxidase family protein [Solirubrobacterales bacterium]
MDARYHPGELEVQRRAGLSDEAERIRDSIASLLSVDSASFLVARRFVVLGATDDDGRVWATALAGPRGFVGVLDARTVRLAAQPPDGDPLSAALHRPAPTPLALIALDPTTRTRVRINGYGGYVDDALYVRVEQGYTNCRKYIATRRLAAREEAGPTEASQRGSELSQPQRRLITETDSFFIASVAGAGADVSHRGGNPGFVRVVSARRLSWPDYRGNAMFNTLGNLSLKPRAGLLFIDWESGDTLQLAGSAQVDWSPERAREVAGAQRMVDFTVEAVVEAPRALPLSWELVARSPFNP